MKYQARFPGVPNGEATRVVMLLGAPHFAIDVGDARVEGHAVSPRPGVWSFVTPFGRQIEVSLERAPSGAVRARIGARSVRFDLLDDLTALASSAAARGGARKTDTVAAAMPGRVLRVAVAPGDTVTEGQALLVLEAMKMENEVKAPRDGVIASVEAEPGRAVSAGDVLVRFAG